jgi:hypothetical protein
MSFSGQNQAGSSQIKPNQTKSNQIKPKRTESNRIKPAVVGVGQDEV